MPALFLSPTSPPLHSAHQLFLAFNATAHSLVANSLSRRAEGRAAEVLARLAQLAVALSIPVAVALFVGRGLLPDLFTGAVCVGGSAWTCRDCRRAGATCAHRSCMAVAGGLSHSGAAGGSVTATGPLLLTVWHSLCAEDVLVRHEVADVLPLLLLIMVSRQACSTGAGSSKLAARQHTLAASRFPAADLPLPSSFPHSHSRWTRWAPCWRAASWAPATPG